MKKIKIFTTNSGKSEEQIVREINAHISKGWKVKGNMVAIEGSLKIMLQKKIK
jgi:hypothetical protein